MARNSKQIKIYEDIASLKTDMENVKTDVKDVIENHLPHLIGRIEKVERAIYMAGGALIVIQLVLKFLIK